jgi:hypothetical protein
MKTVIRQPGTKELLRAISHCKADRAPSLPGCDHSRAKRQPGGGAGTAEGQGLGAKVEVIQQ